jgi:SAM-dependent methyltransferase
VRGAGRLRRLIGRDTQRELPRELIELTAEDRRYLSSLYDDSLALPEGAAGELSGDNPRLLEIKAAYAALDLPVLTPSRWNESAVSSFLDLQWFRGESLFYWHYRELPRITALKYFVWLGYIQRRDEPDFLDRLDEDGAFGCWTFDYTGHGRVSRDLLESVNEILFLERELKLSARTGFSVLDIGAGYGRLADRMSAALPNVTDYCCVDAVAEATFLSGYYLRHRARVPPARVVRLDHFEAEVEPGDFDLAVNIHSWPECTYAAVDWWVSHLERLAVPNLLVIPNEPTELLSLEPDGRRLDLIPLLESAGYNLVKREPVIDDAATRELLRLHDHFHLFELG